MKASRQGKCPATVVHAREVRIDSEAGDCFHLYSSRYNIILALLIPRTHGFTGSRSKSQGLQPFPIKVIPFGAPDRQTVTGRNEVVS